MRQSTPDAIQTAPPARALSIPNLALALMLLVLSACQPAPSIEPIPTLTVLEVHISPALRIFAPQFQSCAAELPNTGLALLESLASDEQEAPPGLSLRWGAEPAPRGYAAVIAQEDLLVIVHPERPLTRITADDLRAIYQGRQFEWEDGGAGEIEALGYPAGTDSQRIFESAVMEGSPVSTGAMGVVPDPAAMLEAVAASPNAIGFLPAHWLNEQVKQVAVDGFAPERLRAPILGLAEREPRGAQKAWLICLQETLR